MPRSWTRSKRNGADSCTLQLFPFTTIQFNTDTAMIIYNVTIKLHPGIMEEWLQWMKQEHIPDLMRTGLFLEYKLCRLMEQDDSEGPTFVVQYFCDSPEHYETYVS